MITRGINKVVRVFLWGVGGGKRPGSLVLAG